MSVLGRWNGVVRLAARSAGGVSDLEERNVGWSRRCKDADGDAEGGLREKEMPWTVEEVGRRSNFERGGAASGAGGGC